MIGQIEYILKWYLSFDFQENDPSLEDVSLKNWMSEVLILCRSAASFDQANAIIEPRNIEYSSSINFNDKVPYSSLLLFYVFYKWDKYTEATKWATDAIDEFKQRGKTHNQIISLWIRALVLEEEKHIEDAQNDIEDALELLDKKVADCKRITRMKFHQNKYENFQKQLCTANDRLRKKLKNNVSIDRAGPEESGGIKSSDENHRSSMHPPIVNVNVPIDINLSNQMRAILSDVDAQANIIAKSGKSNLSSDPLRFQSGDVSSGTKKSDEPEEISLPWLPVFHQPRVEANPEGKGYILEDAEMSPTAISHVIIEGQEYTIHVIKKTATRIDRHANLVSSRRYAWVKVSGDSMKDFDPKIEDGDYVLYYPQQDSPDDNLVIVRQPDESTGQILRLIKRYKKSENLLYSHNDIKNYPPLPLCEDCLIIGIVVAVAKPRKE